MWTVSAFQQHPNTMIIVDEVGADVTSTHTRVVLKKFGKINFCKFKDLQYVALEFG